VLANRESKVPDELDILADYSCIDAYKTGGFQVLCNLIKMAADDCLLEHHIITIPVLIDMVRVRLSYLNSNLIPDGFISYVVLTNCSIKSVGNYIISKHHKHLHKADLF